MTRLRGARGAPEINLAEPHLADWYARFRATMQRHGLLETPAFGGGDLGRLPASLVSLVAGPLPRLG
ncbi:MAG: hypothetical protein ACREQM_22160 [Candidatus Dormibacteraceae bacterium]